jgi:hypothetical protein
VNLAEWHQVLATEPATPNQIGAIHREFARLGVTDRAERLAICAALLGVDDLGSTTHLVMGQAGQLYAELLGLADRDELLAAAGLDDEHQGEAPGSAPTFAEVIRAALVQLYATIAQTRTRGGV